ncbi:MAG: hypothetical protein K2N91_02015, partial [Muribaculaceae bacterium]|nr:hypothetical protein [Muribaculaceae bacterium]
PMQGDYMPLSPTLYCGADPVNRVDPTGMRFENKLSPEDYEIFISNIQEMCKSKEFDTLFKYLDKSGTVYEISFEDLDDDKVAYVDTKNPDNIRIVFSKQRISYFTLGEEFFHAFQYESSDWYRLAEVNKEFEAQSFAYFIYQVMLDGSAPAIIEGALDKTLFSDCFDKEGNYVNTLKSVVNKDGFASHYKKSANRFIENAINSPTQTNENYKMPNNSAPVGILLLVNILMKLL